MSKFCGNCGKPMDDDALVCGNCGTPYSGETEVKGSKPVKISGVNTMAPEKKKKIKLIVKLSALGVAIIIVAVIAINIISSFTGYKGAVNTAFNAFKNYDINTLVSMTSDIAYNGIDSNKIEESISKDVSATLDSYESVAGHDMSISYDITDSYKLSDRKYQEFLKYVEQSYNYDSSDISEVVKVDLDIKTKGSLGESNYPVNDLYMIKERGNWYIYKGYVGNYY